MKPQILLQKSSNVLLVKIDGAGDWYSIVLIIYLRYLWVVPTPLSINQPMVKYIYVRNSLVFQLQ